MKEGLQFPASPQKAHFIALFRGKDVCDSSLVSMQQGGRLERLSEFNCPCKIRGVVRRELCLEKRFVLAPTSVLAKWLSCLLRVVASVTSGEAMLEICALNNDDDRLRRMLF